MCRFYFSENCRFKICLLHCWHQRGETPVYRGTHSDTGTVWGLLSMEERRGARFHRRKTEKRQPPLVWPSNGTESRGVCRKIPIEYEAVGNMGDADRWRDYQPRVREAVNQVGNIGQDRPSRWWLKAVLRYPVWMSEALSGRVSRCCQHSRQSNNRSRPSDPHIQRCWNRCGRLLSVRGWVCCVCS